MNENDQKLCLDLKDKDENVRRAAIVQLAELGNLECIPLLRRAVKNDEDDLVRRAAVHALQQMGDWEGIRPALLDANFSVRETAIEALGGLGDLEGVRSAFHDENFIVRMAVVRSLGMMRNQGGLPLLRLALQDENQHIRIAVVREFGRWGLKEELLLALQNNDEKVRSKAVRELGKLMEWEGVEQGFRDTHPTVRTEAVSALVGLGDMLGDREAALRYARLALQDTNPQVRKTAIEVLGELYDQECIPQLQLALRDPDEDVRNTAVEIMESLEFGNVEFAYLVLKRFEVLYKEFAQKPEFKLPIYALPLFGTDWNASRVRYHGLDRDPLSAWDDPLASLAEIRMAEIRNTEEDGVPYWVNKEYIFRAEDLNEVLKWAEEEVPGEYEPVWARVAGFDNTPPISYNLAGYEPSYFPCGFFSPLCDCMCFPRWHGTDQEGALFSEYFKRLNSYGLFDSWNDANDFLTYYLSFDWTETGEYQIIEVWIPEK